MQYNYEDEFLTKNIDDEKLTRIEDTAIKEIDKINITDMFYFEKLVILNVYIQLAKMNYEAEGIDKKYTILLNEYNTLLKELQSSSTVDTKPSVKSVKLVRG